jgi:hypothetical protein
LENEEVKRISQQILPSRSFDQAKGECLDALFMSHETHLSHN